MKNIEGLSNKEVIENRKKYGNNIFSKKKRDSFLKLLLETFSDPIIKILLIALGIKIIFLIRDFSWYETIGIVIAIMVASLISSISEYGSMKVFDKLTEDSSKIKVRVKREGQVKEINITDIVYGDIVILASGDKVPADGVVIFGHIAVDESMMNGESNEVFKEVNDKVYMPSVVYSGEALVRIDAIGDKTMYGMMAQELQEDDNISPLKERLSKLAQGISKLGYIFSIIAALSYLFYMIVISNNFNIDLIMNTVKNFNLMFSYVLEALTLCVTIIVVAVPEGLPMMITLVLSSNMKRMLKSNVLVRKLVGIETAGNIQVLLTDKTGTITTGNLEVVTLLDGNGEEITYGNTKINDLFHMGMSINNDSVLDDMGKVVGGNVTDRAILRYAGRYLEEYEIREKQEFDSKNKYMYTKVRMNGKTYNLVKGAYEVIEKMCNNYIDKNGNKKNLNKEMDEKIKNLSMSKYRVITLAYNEDRETLNNLTLLGFIILSDKIRENVNEGIRLVQEAGIETIMITGDNRETAYGIAKDIGLITEEDDLVINSEYFNKMSDEEVIKNFLKIKVIARAMPQDKSRLVMLAQRQNLVVGMTGDGVNDALALKKADVGFAMGSGTEVAKEASDIVILDDNFYSITKAILYGRTIFKSIRKFIICQLTINLCSLNVSIIGPYIGVPVPITVIQMLWINMIMDTLSGFAFSYEPALYEYMREKPKKKDEHIINKYMLNQILISGISSSIICIFFLKSKLINEIFGDNILTAFFGLIIFISIFNSFNARTYRLNILGNIKKNKIFILVISFVIIMQIYLLYYGGNLFRTSGLSIKEFMIMLGISSLVIPIDFIRKLILKYQGKKLGV